MQTHRNNPSKTAAGLVAMTFALLTLSLPPAQAQDADRAATEGLKEVKVAFDLKLGDPKALLGSLKVVDNMRRSLIERGVTPHIVLTFRGPASKLVQTDRSKIAAEHRKGAAAVAARIDALRSAKGIGSMEQCGLTVAALGLKPQNTVRGVTVVDNSWTTLAAYQAKGYSYIVP